MQVRRFLNNRYTVIILTAISLRGNGGEIVSQYPALTIMTPKYGLYMHYR